MNARLLVPVLFAASLGACDGATHYEYNSMAEAKQDQSVKAAAIPALVPGSARAIAGKYYVETNAGSVEFSFDKSEVQHVIAGFHPADKAEAERIADEMGRWSWKQPPASSALDFYVRSGPEYARETLAIDKSASRAFWIGTGHIDQPTRS